MVRSARAVLLVLVMIGSTSAVAWEQRPQGKKKVSLTIVGTRQMANQALEVNTDAGGRFIVRLDSNGVATLELNAVAGKPLGVTAHMTGFAAWRTTVGAADSSVAWRLYGQAGYPMAPPPWPQVTWRTQAGAPDVYVDGQSVGTAGPSPLTRAVSPSTAHRFQWRNAAGQIVCDTADSLPPGSTRCHVCDPVLRRTAGC